MSQEQIPLIRIDDLYKYYPVSRSLSWSKAKHFSRAVDGISLTINQQQTLGLVGESGCGKTTTGKMILLQEKPTSGKIVIEEKDIFSFQGESLIDYRKQVQAVFQDPRSSMNSRRRVRDIIGEPLYAIQHLRGNDITIRVQELMTIVGLDPDLIKSYPHELSGGMVQRVAVARALALNPAMIVLDEPVSALDVSTRVQIMNVFKQVQEKFGVAYLLISHNLTSVRYLSHQVAVMYLGKIVEYADSEDLFTDPQHPYTQALISAAAPVKLGEARDKIILTSEVPSPINPPSGCRFHTRCPVRLPVCSEVIPELVEHTTNHRTACHLLSVG